MNLIGNLIWIVFGGFFVALEYLLTGILLCFTIVGIPFGLQLFKLAHLMLTPFGRHAVYIEHAPGCLSTVMNILWIFLGGIWIALTHLFFGIFFAITIIGFPFAQQHFKLMSLSFTPFGREVRRM
jgi:uncharacterized membrane protein YccF (DUF307 family)